jgi:hypothetical protein
MSIDVGSFEDSIEFMEHRANGNYLKELDWIANEEDEQSIDALQPSKKPRPSDAPPLHRGELKPEEVYVFVPVSPSYSPTSK